MGETAAKRTAVDSSDVGAARMAQDLSRPVEHGLVSHTPNAWLRTAAVVSMSLNRTNRDDGARGNTASPEPVAETETKVHMVVPERALLRLKEVMALTGLSRSTVYKMEKCGQFCGRVEVTPRRVAWRLEDVHAWIRSRTRKSK